MLSYTKRLRLRPQTPYRGFTPGPHWGPPYFTPLNWNPENAPG